MRHIRKRRDRVYRPSLGFRCAVWVPIDPGKPADYRIVYLDDNYEQTIIGRNARDYVWVMARTPQISDADYSELISVVESLGYELTNLRKSPHEENK